MTKHIHLTLALLLALTALPASAGILGTPSGGWGTRAEPAAPRPAGDGLFSGVSGAGKV
ncbi:hypothetical protein M4578_22940 [Salipiger sp. P9]|uniref:hypothetical protein n=1 Tax=Salipiger pentaromativorans TaxID=2943193 RepID=UPI00215876FE|nr:hypothetical protein [Salipiger pentaromativorans]MCR8550691.1 hypothetical protein [Salipiger pentaromativorans]